MGMSVPLHFCTAAHAEFKFLNLHALLTPFGIHSRKLGLQQCCAAVWAVRGIRGETVRDSGKR